MRETIFKSATCHWLDVTAPTPSELKELAEAYKIHPVLLEDCFDPEHLPKYEATPACLFTILRVYDYEATADSLTMQQPTRKLVLVLLDGVLVTIHRAPLPFLTTYCERLEGTQPPSPIRLFYEICKAAIMTYDQAFLSFEDRLEKFEDTIGHGKAGIDVFLNVRQEARRLSTMKRLLWHTLAIFQRMPLPQDTDRIYAHDLQETVQSLMFFADELAEDAGGLVSLELSLNAHRNNQVIRVLTLFSVFFMPLTFIVGVYGMNFRYMPELEWRFGYGMVWVVMLVTVVAIAMWFRKRGWFDG